MPAPSGSRATASSTPSPCRSSVINQRRGRGWLGRMALPIAKAMVLSPLQAVRARIDLAGVQHGPGRGRDHPDRNLQDPERRRDRGADRRRAARVRRESGAGGAGEVAGPAWHAIPIWSCTWSDGCNRTRRKRRFCCSTRSIRWTGRRWSRPWPRRSRRRGAGPSASSRSISAMSRKKAAAPWPRCRRCWKRRGPQGSARSA